MFKCVSILISVTVERGLVAMNSDELELCMHTELYVRTCTVFIIFENI